MLCCCVANDFFKTYFISLLQDILGVLTDTLHKPGFRLQSLILAKLFSILETGTITVPLWLNAVRHTHTHSTAPRRSIDRSLARADLALFLVVSLFSRIPIPVLSPTTWCTFVSSCARCF